MTKHNLNRLLPYKVHQKALIRRNSPFDLNPIILYSQVAWFQKFFPRQFGAQRLLFGYLPSFHNRRLEVISRQRAHGISQSIVSNLSSDTYLGGNCSDIDPKCRCSRDTGKLHSTSKLLAHTIT